MLFQGVGSKQGLSLYHFTQKVDPVDMETLPVPASMVGRPGSGSVTVHRFVESSSDFWVEPVTGTIIAAESRQIQTLRDTAGQSLLTVADVDSALTEATQRESARLAKDGIRQLGLLRTTGPLAALLLGLVAIALSVALLRGMTFRSLPFPGRRAPAGQGRPQSAPTSPETAEIDLRAVAQQADLVTNQTKADQPRSSQF